MARGRALLVPAALLGIAAIVSVIGVGGHAGQTGVVVGDSLTAAGTSEIMAALSADGWKPIVEGVSGSSMTNRNQVLDWRVGERISPVMHAGFTCRRGCRYVRALGDRSSLGRHVVAVGVEQSDCLYRA
jgi:hypothetical protein